MNRNTEVVTYNRHWFDFTDEEIEMLWRLVNTISWTSLPQEIQQFCWAFGRNVQDLHISADPVEGARLFDTNTYPSTNPYDTENT